MCSRYQNQRVGNAVPLALMMIWILFITFCFDKYAYEISEFNNGIRVFVTMGKPAVREFDSAGLPVSYSTRQGKMFRSPFYVIHYGILYSDAIQERALQKGFHWRNDPSMVFWNLPPPAKTKEYFRNCAEWVLEKIDYTTGRAHLIYDFEWPYRGYPNGRLTPPWWSGLTDGYAIILLLRAYDVFGDIKYIRAAQELYESVLTPIAKGGSLNEVNGHPWIEEYVDPKVNAKDMSFVLNGMVYASFGVDAFERCKPISAGMAQKLYESIADNLETFDLRGWSYYDRIGTPANMKYHRIHVALLHNLEQTTGDTRYSAYHDRWAKSLSHIGVYWLIRSDWSVSKMHFIVTILVFTAIGPAAIILTRRRLAIRGSAVHADVTKTQ